MIRVLFALAIVATLGLSACAAVPLFPMEGSENLVSGNYYFSIGEVAEADSCYNKAAISSNTDVKAGGFAGLAKISQHKRKHNKAIEYLTSAAELDHTAYDEQLAQAYIKRGKKSDLQKATELLEPYQATSANANIELGHIASAKKDKSKATTYYQTAKTLLTENYKQEADTDGSEAILLARLNWMYKGLDKNYPEAESWYRQSIAQGNLEALGELAQLWTESKTRQNPKEDAFALMIQAAEAGDQDAILYVANAYRDGNGVKKNNETSLSWYKKLPSDIYKNKMEALADHYMFDLPYSKANLDTALSHYVTAAESSSIKGSLIANAYGKKAKTYSNKELLNQAAKLEKKYGAKHSNVIFKVYKYLADKGVAEAQFKTGLMYSNGSGVDKDLDKAKAWLEKAKNNGYNKAQQNLDSLFPAAIETNVQQQETTGQEIIKDEPAAVSVPNPTTENIAAPTTTTTETAPAVATPAPVAAPAEVTTPKVEPTPPAAPTVTPIEQPAAAVTPQPQAINPIIKPTAPQAAVSDKPTDISTGSDNAEDDSDAVDVITDEAIKEETPVNQINNGAKNEQK